jgi:hypothetical protein
VYQRAFSGPEAVDWLTLNALKAIMDKENCVLTQRPNERLRILSRSAALLLAQRLLETKVYMYIYVVWGQIYSGELKVYMCPHTAIYVSSYYYMFPHTTVYESDFVALWGPLRAQRMLKT